jgi:hypothetical protein
MGWDGTKGQQRGRTPQIVDGAVQQSQLPFSRLLKIQAELTCRPAVSRSLLAHTRSSTLPPPLIGCSVTHAAFLSAASVSAPVPLPFVRFPARCCSPVQSSPPSAVMSKLAFSVHTLKNLAMQGPALTKEPLRPMQIPVTVRAPLELTSRLLGARGRWELPVRRRCQLADFC